MVGWSQVCLPKDQGGLGILNLDIMNIALLAKWLWKLFNTEGVWQTLLRNKYLHSLTLRQVTFKNGDSHVWQGLMEIKKLFLSCFKIKIGNGRKTNFWDDCWLGEYSLADSFPRLFHSSQEQHIIVQATFERGIRNLTFRRAMVGERGNMWV
jgi:hypothetical protein